MRVAIVGGGISGLALAERIAAEGAEPIVLEAEVRAGGKVRSVRRDGFVLEAGPNGFLDKEPATFALAERIGLGAALQRATAAAGRRWIRLRGALREVPTTPGAFLGSNVLPWTAKLRMAGEIFSRRKEPGKDESVAEFGRRHIGCRATRDLLGAMVLGIYGGDVERLSMQSCFPRLAAIDEAHRSLLLGMIRMRRERRRLGPAGSAGAGGPAGPGGVLTSVEGGLGAYVGRLAERLGEIVRTGTRVDRLERVDGRWRLHAVSPSGGAELEADAVVLAVPGDAAAHLLGPHDAALGDLAAGIEYAPMGVVHLAWPRERIAHPLDGFGFLVPPHEGLRILGAMFVSTFFPWRAPAGQALFTVMIGGAVRPELVRGASDAALAAIAREELAPIVGASGEPSLCEVVRWERAIPQYVVGHEARVREAEARVARLPGLHLAGNAWRGIGFNDCVAAAPRIAAAVLGR